MRDRALGTLLVVFLLLGSAVTASAEQVVVLPMSGDKKDKLRPQIEAALKKSGKVKLFPLAKYKAEAAKRRVKQPMSVDGFSKLAGPLRLDAAVVGTAGRRLEVRVVDRFGSEMSSKAVALGKNGLIAAGDLPKLAKLVSSPQQTGGMMAEAAAPEPEPMPAPAAESSGSSAPVLPSLNEAPAEATQTESEGPRVQVTSEPDAEPAPRRGGFAGPPMITVKLGASGTLRNYCSRPGADTCAGYDSLAVKEKNTVDFQSKSPYPGVGLSAELFPLASKPGMLRGIGFGAGFARSFPSVDVNANGAALTQVSGADTLWYADARPRYYFAAGPGLAGYAGLRLGVESHSFAIGDAAKELLPGSSRLYGKLGVQAAYPFSKLLQLEAGATYHLSSGTSGEDLKAYGTSVTGSGYGVEGALTGRLYNQIGYDLRVNYARFADVFSGVGTKWTGGKGAAEESYTGFNLGLTASF